MSESVDSRLDNLVVREWSLVKTLWKHAERFRKDLLADLRRALEEHPEFELGRATAIRTGGSHFYVAYEHDRKYVSYTQVDFRGSQVSLEVRVWTGFSSNGVSTRSVKSQLSPELLEPRLDRFEEGAEVKTLLKRIPVVGVAREDLQASVAKEVIDQMQVADALFEIVLGLRGQGV